jgi:hypothetical protein
MSRSRAALVLFAAMAMILSAGCRGGKDTGPSLIPTLAGTPIPTVSPVPPTAAVCTPPQPLALPANFPSEIPMPPDLTVFGVKTAPYLEVIVRVSVPIDPGRNEPAHGIAADAIVSRLNEKGWRAALHDRIDGLDYDLTSPEGHVLHFNAISRPECSGVVQLTFGVKWITP